MNKKLVKGLIALLLIVLVSLAVVYRDHIDTDKLNQWLQGLGWVAPVVFVAMYSLATVLFLPGSVLTLLGGALFGPLWGTVFNLTGATIGALLAFLLSRYLAADWAERKAAGFIKSLKQGVEDEGWRFIAFVRLVPLFPFNALNYALGLTRINVWTYLWASALFMLPGAIAYTYLGYAGKEALTGGEDLVQKLIWAGALLAVVAFIPRWIKKARR